MLNVNVKPRPKASAPVAAVPALHVIGLLVTLAVASSIAWGTPFIWTAWQQPAAGGLVFLAASAYAAGALVTQQLHQYPRARSTGLALFTTCLVFMVILALLVFTRWYYSRSFLVSTAVLTVFWQTVIARATTPRDWRVAIVPGGSAERIANLPGVRATVLSEPRLPEGQDALVADLTLSPGADWQRFLADRLVRGTRVFHAALLFEDMTGRLDLDAGLLALDRPDVWRVYAPVKRLLDVLLVIVTLPITAPIMLLTALVVRLDSPGAVLFSQERVGQADEPFTIYKFRTMRADAESRGQQFASVNDQRITRVGRFLRKARIDELPQLFNVLRGDMSLIGPRPEQRAFTDSLQAQLPLYAYRHLVKPGLSGWAQVNQGYAAGVDETREKISYDLYYVKHLSPWLDLLIVGKTIRTILTGFGAR